ncbi:hypothetical protein [Chitinophaga sp. S165]|uniref:hypothetical protein n=1 Tax=Chitinophaga sp. S165 TaxID=2135462 RepID=UPI000D70DDC7|nr:hypothetical protein [Chitinophaga sp. S165]PWV45156.1 hypothetical protein C7475_1158 [Chitinophaga sp. S165]
MKTLYLSLLLLVLFSACKETATNAQQQTSHKVISPADRAVYKSMMTNEFCDCFSEQNMNKKPSVAIDTCFKIIAEKFADELKDMGVDTSLSPVESHLIDNINIFACGNAIHLMEEEKIAEEAKLLLVKGQFISQKKLSTGEYEVVLREDKTGKQRVLKSKNLFNEELVKDKSLGYELTVEYKIVKNKKTGKDEQYVKDASEGGLISVTGPVEFEVEK